MASDSPSIPKGTRDFSPEEMIRRNYIFTLIRKVFEKYGYIPIETPAMENLGTLLGKYGEEGDRLLFKILNSGDYLAGIEEKDIHSGNISKFTSSISEKGLRYDLTVPFARYVVQHRNDITFPFKRYQIQPVWRADRPQKGRYREFYQCDVDVIGSDSLLNEVELVQIIDEVFSTLNIRVEIRLNNRKVLAGIAEYLGHPDKFYDITVAMDKLDKVGPEGVRKELLERGIPGDAADKLEDILKIDGSAKEKIKALSALLASETGAKGLKELDEVISCFEEIYLRQDLNFDLTLARGLNYYTGTIFEVKARDVEIGSICGGGRYDDLTGIFGLEGVSGVGISFGADRIYDVLATLNGFPEELTATTQVLLVNFGQEEQMYCMKLLEKLRKSNIRSELFPDSAKLKKQMKYADQKGIPYVVLVGENEMRSGSLTVKNMKSGEQVSVTIDELVIMISGD